MNTAVGSHFSIVHAQKMKRENVIDSCNLNSLHVRTVWKWVQRRRSRDLLYVHIFLSVRSVRPLHVNSSQGCDYTSAPPLHLGNVHLLFSPLGAYFSEVYPEAGEGLCHTFSPSPLFFQSASCPSVRVTKPIQPTGLSY